MVFMRTQGMVVNDLLGRLGLPGGMIGAQIDMLSGSPIGVLKNLQDAYQEAALGRGTDRFERVMGGQIPPFLSMPSPLSALPYSAPIAGMGYAGGAQRMDLAAGTSNGILSNIFNPERRAAGRFERLLNTNPMARAAFEAQVGGMVLPDGRNDGRITIQRFAPGFAPIPGFAGNPMANTALGLFSGMEQSVLGAAARLGLGGAAMGGVMGLLGGNPFMGLALGGLTGVAAGLLGGGGGFGGGIGGFGLGMGGMGFGGGFGGIGGFGGGTLGGAGAGSWLPQNMPGRINNTNPAYEGAHQAEINNVLADPSLTVEDKVTLMIMLIMKKMDKDIERQAQYINSIQQQQSNRGGGGGGGFLGGMLGPIGSIAGSVFGGPAGGMIGGALGGMLGGAAGGGDGNAPSIDVETMKLKRMIDKRGQMFDMLRQIIDKYNETAKGIIQSIGR